MDLLIWRARQGERAALDAVVREHYPKVHALALRMLGNPAEAHDVAREVMARVLRSLRNYRERQSFRAWVLTIASNVLRDNVRRKKRPLALSEGMEESLTGGAAAGLIPQVEDRDRIRDAFARLPGEEQLLLLQVFQQGLNRDELAETLGVSVNAVRIRLHRTLHILRSLVKGKEPA